MTIHRADGNNILTSPKINVGSDATGDIYYRNASGLFTRLAKGTQNYLLRAGASVPEYAAPNSIITLGSDADGDVYYRNGGVLTRLAKGSNGQFLSLVGGYPAWAAAGATPAGYAAIRSGCISYKDADEIYITANLCKVKNYVVSWTSTLTKQLTSLSNDTLYYIYLDYSGLTDGATVTATEVIYSTTAPTYNTTYYQWMNGDDRCIGFILSDGSGNIKAFTWDYGGFYDYETGVNELSGGTQTSFTDIDCSSSVPAFGEMACLFYFAVSGATQNADQAILDVRKNGSAATDFVRVGCEKFDSSSTNPTFWGLAIRHVDSSRIVEYQLVGVTTSATIAVKGVWLTI